MPWKCFLVKESKFFQISLRRYSSVECPTHPHKHHNGEIVIDSQAPEGTTDGVTHTDTEEVDRKDPRWPTQCGCGYKFHPEDHWQTNVHRLYEGSPDGQLYILRELPVGGMWIAHWLNVPKWQGPDGHAWCVMMPGGNEWVVYGEASDGKGKWKVEGTPPNITVSPSIGMGGQYHGFIKGGVITEDVDGRKYPDLHRTA